MVKSKQKLIKGWRLSHPSVPLKPFCMLQWWTNDTWFLQHSPYFASLERSWIRPSPPIYGTKTHHKSQQQKPVLMQIRCYEITETIVFINLCGGRTIPNISIFMRQPPHFEAHFNKRLRVTETPEAIKVYVSGSVLHIVINECFISCEACDFTSELHSFIYFCFNLSHFICCRWVAPLRQFR